jgi:hypothetical protein
MRQAEVHCLSQQPLINQINRVFHIADLEHQRMHIRYGEADLLMIRTTLQDRQAQLPHGPAQQVAQGWIGPIRQHGQDLLIQPVHGLHFSAKRLLLRGQIRHQSFPRYTTVTAF